MYDTGARRFYGNLGFWAQRYAGKRARYYDWEYVTTHFSSAAPWTKCGDGNGQCQTAQDRVHDFAVVRLRERAGDVHGWLGFTYRCQNSSYRVATAGYPLDRDPRQVRLYRAAGKLAPFPGCAPTPWDVPSGFISSNLDVAVGQSGSPIWDPSLFIRAIHVSYLPNGRPGHRTINREVYDILLPLAV